MTNDVPSTVATPLDVFHYENRTVRDFGVATIAWGVVGFLVGLIVALKLVYPEFLGFIPELSYGRLRPLHTNAVIFVFAGNAIFFGVYYSLPRLCKTPMWKRSLSRIHFWGWLGDHRLRRPDPDAGHQYEQGVR